MEQDEILAEEFDRFCVAGRDVFLERNKLYDSCYEQGGLAGIVAELLGNVSKLRTLVFRTGMETTTPEVQAKLMDTLLDIHNYSIMGQMLASDANWYGIGLEELDF